MKWKLTTAKALKSPTRSVYVRRAHLLHQGRRNKVCALKGTEYLLTKEYTVTTRPRRDTTSSEQRPSTPLQSGPSGSTAQSTTQALPIANKRFQAVINLLHSQISQHRNGNIFHNPIKPTEAPDYHDIIKRPMDLKTIKARIKDGVIRTSRDFQRDVYLMFANAIMYNRPGSDIALMAEEVGIFSLTNCLFEPETVVGR
jgi:hypothetical protein